MESERIVHVFWKNSNYSYKNKWEKVEGVSVNLFNWQPGSDSSVQVKNVSAFFKLIC